MGWGEWDCHGERGKWCCAERGLWSEELDSSLTPWSPIILTLLLLTHLEDLPHTDSLCHIPQTSTQSYRFMNPQTLFHPVATTQRFNHNHSLIWYLKLSSNSFPTQPHSPLTTPASFSHTSDSTDHHSSTPEPPAGLRIWMESCCTR